MAKSESYVRSRGGWGRLGVKDLATPLDLRAPKEPHSRVEGRDWKNRSHTPPGLSGPLRRFVDKARLANLLNTLAEIGLG